VRELKDRQFYNKGAAEHHTVSIVRICQKMRPIPADVLICREWRNGSWKGKNNLKMQWWCSGSENFRYFKNICIPHLEQQIINTANENKISL